MSTTRSGDRPRNNRSLMGWETGMHAGNRTVLFSYARVARVLHRSRTHVALVVFNRYSSYEVIVADKLFFLSSRTPCDERFWAAIGLPAREIRWDYEALKLRDVHEYRRPVYNALIDGHTWNDLAICSHRFETVRGKSARLLSISLKLSESPKLKKNLRFTREQFIIVC